MNDLLRFIAVPVTLYLVVEVISGYFRSRQIVIDLLQSIKIWIVGGGFFLIYSLPTLDLPFIPGVSLVILGIILVNYLTVVRSRQNNNTVPWGMIFVDFIPNLLINSIIYFFTVGPSWG